MRLSLLVIFCTLSFSASAQWWKISLKKHERFPLISHTKDHAISRFPIAKIKAPKILPLQYIRSDYSLQLAEASVMKTAQHNMRFRIYGDASYNFSDLAKLYIQQNRLSEAKWYLLQSNLISRQQNDDRHTLTNLMTLATVKLDLGDYILAKQDLLEARDIARFKGWTADVATIEKRINGMQTTGTSVPRTELRYAEAVEADLKLKQ